ncbi:MAG: hypothetical protein ACHQ52_04340 [Candidatus Eisenbacteria bacterium]
MPNEPPADGAVAALAAGAVVAPDAGLVVEVAGFVEGVEGFDVWAIAGIAKKTSATAASPAMNKRLPLSNMWKDLTWGSVAVLRP